MIAACSTHSPATKTPAPATKTPAPALSVVPSSRPHLTEAQALAIAKPMLRLAAGESYHVRFSNGSWVVWTQAPEPFQAVSTVTIRDSDGQLLGSETRY